MNTLSHKAKHNTYLFNDDLNLLIASNLFIYNI